MTDGRTHTPRGFRIFQNDVEDHVDVLESSLAFEGPHVRIHGGREFAPGERGRLHLSLPQARLVLSGLSQFVAEAEAGRLTEPPHIKPDPDA